MDSLMRGKHAEKKFRAVVAMTPTPLSLKTRGGGGRIQGTPPPVYPTTAQVSLNTMNGHPT